MTYLSECFDEYIDSFTDDWMSSKDWSGTSRRKSILECIHTIELYYTSYSEKFILSILTGEYVTSLEEVKSQIDLFIDAVEEPDIDPAPLSVKGGMLIEQFNLFNNCILRCLRSYKYLIHVYEQKIGGEDIDYLHTPKPIEKSHRAYPQFYFFVRYIQPLCLMEYTFSSSDDALRKLFYIKEGLTVELPSFTNRLIGQALVEKASFLLLKLQHVKENKTTVCYDSAIYNLDSLDLSSSHLKKFEDNFYTLYRKKTLIQFVNQKLQIIESKLYSTDVSISDLILITKCYQKLPGKIGLINKVIEEFVEHSVDDHIGKYDLYALKVLKNYFYNSRFSLNLQTSEFELDDFGRALEEIRSIQEETSIKNYHPYQKALDYLYKNHLSQFEGVNNDNFLKAFSFYEDCLKYYYEAIKWCAQRNFLAFILPFSDSLVEYDNLKVFYPSSFARPLFYNKLEEKYNEYVRNYDKLLMKKFLLSERNKIELLESKLQTLENSNEVLISNLKEDVKKEVKEGTQLSMKFFGLFTTVITFLLTAINVFPKSSNFSQALSAVMGLGIILWLFNSVIYFLLIPPSKQNWKNPVTLFFGIGGLAFMFLLLYAFFNSDKLLG